MSFSIYPKQYVVSKYKRCRVCKSRLAFASFHKCSTAPDGYQYTCKKCQMERKKIYLKGGSPKLKLDGQRFGRLLVVSYAGIKDSRTSWNCICDCGKTRVLFGSALKIGNVKSCGCLSADTARERLILPFGEAIQNKIIKSYLFSASSRGLAFTLTHEQLLRLFAGNCFYCGSPPSNKQARRQTNGGFTYSGIDRYDNRVGYTPENCVSCCRLCNLAKRDLTVEDFLDWAHRVAEHTSKFVAKEAQIA